MKPFKTMASISFVLLSLALVISAIAAPVEQANTTAATDDVPLVEVLEVIAAVPVVKLEEGSSKAAKEAEHKVVKRSAFRGDNPSNDLLANFDELNYENGLTGLAGRKIRFLPTWLGK